MSPRLRQPIPWTTEDELIRSARATRARYMHKLFANGLTAGLRWYRRNRERRNDSRYDPGPSSSRRR